MNHQQASPVARGTYRDTGALSPYLEGVAAMLHQQQYAATSIRGYLREAGPNIAKLT